MDITLIKTFLEVAATGSFVEASERLFVTQSAISLRIRKLEETLGKSLFIRSKAGASMTSAGVEFERYALSLLKIWEESRQQIALPEGFRKHLSIGAQYSLWPRLGFRWIDALRNTMPDLNIRAEVGMPNRLTRFLVEGVIQVGLLYNPQLRPGLTVKPVMEDELILVASWENPSLDDLKSRYAFIDWGTEFVHAHAMHLPQLSGSGLHLTFGILGTDFILRRELAAYLPARHIKGLVDAGKLFYVPDAPTFPYPLWSVWRDDLDEDVAKIAQQTLNTITTSIDHMHDTVFEMLNELSSEGAVDELGKPSAMDLNMDFEDQ